MAAPMVIANLFCKIYTCAHPDYLFQVVSIDAYKNHEEYNMVVYHPEYGFCSEHTNNVEFTSGPAPHCIIELKNGQLHALSTNSEELTVTMIDHDDTGEKFHAVVPVVYEDRQEHERIIIAKKRHDYYKDDEEQDYPLIDRD